MRSTRIAGVVVLLAAGCAAEQKSAQAPPAATQPALAGGGASAQEAPAQAAPDSRAPPAPSTALPAPPPPGSRAASLTQAGNDVEASQRELDVAGGDCRNACRALGSMDRAAGRMCGLAQSNDEVQRCRDAKTRVQNARDKVRSTCGSCPDVTVDRNAPIPSLR